MSLGTREGRVRARVRVTGFEGLEVGRFGNTKGINLQTIKLQTYKPTNFLN